ncbi:MAG: carbohydrate ABC transporter permease [Oscillospiraceae bacterium]|jgi:lactose/L-arabinose transport system permease protein|nr:carbohydrate ABC transporter permease [Oscillospiraceae bacterium]
MKRRLGAVAKYGFLIAVSLVSLFPLYWMAVSATNSSLAVIRGALLPGKELINNYRNLLGNQDLWRAMTNSFVNALSLTALALLVCSVAGYAFEIYHTRAKDALMNVLLLAMMIPFAATMIPLFRMFSDMQLISTTIAVILPTISTPFLIMLFRQSARSFPHDIIEAARIDGLGELRIFFRMFFPTMRSTYAAAMTIVFMNAWNNYLWPRIILFDSKSLTMPMLVSNLIFGYVTDYGMLMLAVLICTLTTIIIFFFLQKSFAEGIVGAIK